MTTYQELNTRQEAYMTFIRFIKIRRDSANFTLAENERLMDQLLALRGDLEAAWAEIEADYDEVDKTDAPKAPVMVYYEEGYRWSVCVEGEENIVSNVTKVHAMDIAKNLCRIQGRQLVEQKLTKQQRSENMRAIWEESRNYGYEQRLFSR